MRISLLMAGAAMLVLSACVPPTTQNQADANCVVGATGGAVLGGILGSQVGGGTGQALATAAGATVGGLAGSQAACQ